MCQSFTYYVGILNVSERSVLCEGLQRSLENKSLPLEKTCAEHKLYKFMKGDNPGDNMTTWSPKHDPKLAFVTQRLVC